MERQDLSLNYIYGTGKFGNCLFGIFKEMGVKVDYFVQTETPIKKNVENIPLISYRDMKKIEGNKNIFIAINDCRTVNMIKKKINELGCKNKILVYDCRNFVNDNVWHNASREALVSGEKHCIICGSDLKEFLPGGIKHDIFKKHHIIGGGYRNNYLCPCCDSSDRERWLCYILKTKTDIESMQGRILHFAPEKNVQELICKNPAIDYYTGDIRAGVAMHVTDITDIQYADDVFDYVISNHVMEHILDEGKAVSEIKRIMKKNGKWIFSFPICTDMKTLEDDNVAMPEERLNTYGQEDHVRLYGIDYKERFEKYGLKIQVFSPEVEFNKADIDKFGFIKDDVIMIAQKCN